MFECGAVSVSGHGVGMQCANFSVKLFVCNLMLMFRLAQVFKTSSGHGYRMPVTRRTSIASFPGG